jgi:hypothetical protein
MPADLFETNVRMLVKKGDVPTSQLNYLKEYAIQPGRSHLHSLHFSIRFCRILK